MPRKILSIPRPQSRQVVRASRTSCVERFEDADGAWFLKTYRYRGIRAACRGAFRNTFCAPSRVARERRALLHLARAGVQEDLEPEILERRRLGFLQEGRILTRDFGGRDLASRLDESSVAGDGGLDEDTWIAFGAFVFALHESGLRDPDLKARNILVREEPWSFAKIDASSSTIRRRPAGHRIDRAWRRDLRVLIEDLRRCGLAGAPFDRMLRALYAPIIARYPATALPGHR